MAHMDSGLLLALGAETGVESLGVVVAEVLQQLELVYLLSHHFHDESIPKG